MLSPFISLASALRVPFPEPVFSRVSITPDLPTKINLSGRVAVIIDAPPFNYTVTPGNATSSHSPHVRLTGESLSLSTTSPATLPLWLLPGDFCGSATAVLSTAHFLLLTTRSATRRDPLCLFTQSQFDEAEVTLIFKSKDRGTNVTFHAAVGADSQQCRVSEKCRFHEHQPFFLRIHGDPKLPSAMKLEYEIDEPAPGVECAVTAVAPGEIIANILPGGNCGCRSQAADVISVLGFVGLALLGAFVAAACFNGWKAAAIGDWLFRDSEKQRFETLKKTPFANPLGDAHAEQPEGGG
jgi:hypothetical protein